MNYAFCVLVAFLFALPIQSTRAQSPSKQKKDPDNPLFRLLDGNHDGVLDPYEALDVLSQVESELEGEAISSERIAKILKEIEQDELNEISEMLSEMDVNEDGKTTLDEMDEEMRGFAEMLDENKDGVITAAEGRQADFEDQMFMSPEEIRSEVGDIFGALDQNKDGKLTKDEADEEFSWSQMSEGDSDRDGKVTKSEMIAFMTSDNQRAEFKIVGNAAVMSGVICADTPAKVLRLVHEHPTIRTIEMANVPGSIDDEANLRAAGYIRKFGFATILKSNGVVASGGTDFFLAGKTRTFESGAKFGIHSWGGPDFQGKDVPRDDPQHQLYLKFYKEMGIPAEFYWRTLEAAPANDIHWMTEKELMEFKFRAPDSKTKPSSPQESKGDPAKEKHPNKSEDKTSTNNHLHQHEPYWATLNAANQADCKAAGGYWYNGKCWKNFAGDAGIPNDDVDRIVAEELEQIAMAKVSFDGKEHRVEFAFPEMEDGQATLIVGFNGMQENLLIECAEKDILEGGTFKANSVYVQGNLFEAEDERDLKFTGSGQLQVTVKEDFEINIAGTIDHSAGKKMEVKAYINEAIIGAGNSQLEIKDGQAYLSGTLGTVTYPQIKNLIENHPEIKTVTLTEVEGSVNDAINMHTGRILREAGLNTRVLPDSEIASGGVDLFCAGVRRYGAKGAKVGVHSWGGQGYTAGELPKDHPDHQFQIAYFDMVLGEGSGKGFYFYTLQAAPFEDVHWMSVDELNKWKVVTDWSEQSTGTTDRQLTEIKSTRIAPINEAFPAKFRDAFDRYVQVIAPNGKPINIFAQKEISDAQLRHVRDVMLHYLTNLSGSEFGSQKAKVANRMADNGATMMICRGHDGQFREPRIQAQPLYADETIVEGTSAYINCEFEEHRDATLEEILHCVHDNGIGVDFRGAPRGVLPEFQKEIRAATSHAMKNGIWPTENSDDQSSDWIEELSEEGSLTQEYLASVIDSYYGLWGPFDEDIGMWGIYIAKTRADIKQKDAQGFAIVEKFFHPFLTYEAEIDSAFEGTFSMAFDAKKPYTHKSQYLLHARLTGKLNSNLSGNAQDNRLSGNAGDNVLNGQGGNDTVVFPRKESVYKVEKQSDGSVKVTGDGTDTLINIENVVFDGQEIDEQRFVEPVPHGLSRQ